MAANPVRGRVVSIRIDGVTISESDVAITRPDGTYLVAPTLMDTNGKFFSNLELNPAGTYTLLVNPRLAAVGQMQITITLVATEDASTCRWPHIQGQVSVVRYRWSTELRDAPLDPTDRYRLWRTAFEAAINNWNAGEPIATPLLLHLEYADQVGEVLLDVRLRPDLAGFGYGSVSCGGLDAITGEAWGNLAWDPIALNPGCLNPDGTPCGHSAQFRQALSGQELGHSLALGHTVDPDIALMKDETGGPVGQRWGIDYWTRQPLDAALVYQAYP